MPNAKVLEEKKALVASLVEKIKNSPAGVLVDHKGITVEDDTYGVVEGKLVINAQ